MGPWLVIQWARWPACCCGSEFYYLSDSGKYRRGPDYAGTRSGIDSEKWKRTMMAMKGFGRLLVRRSRLLLPRSLEPIANPIEKNYLGSVRLFSSSISAPLGIPAPFSPLSPGKPSFVAPWSGYLGEFICFLWISYYFCGFN